jgi:hypothetical protein
MHVLAVDPSMTSPGAAWFSEGELVAATYFSQPRKRTSEDRAVRCLIAARDVYEWATGFDCDNAGPDTIAIEWPQIYPHDPVPPNSLPPVAAVGIALVALYAVDPLVRDEPRVVSYLPREWAGNIPKVKSRDGNPWESPRGRRILGRLTEREKRVALAETSDDAMDAIGIVLHCIGRFTALRSYPGAAEG